MRSEVSANHWPCMVERRSEIPERPRARSPSDVRRFLINRRRISTLIPTIYIIYSCFYLLKKNEIDVSIPMVCDNELYTSPLPNILIIPKKYSVQRSHAPIGLIAVFRKVGGA